MQFSGTRLNRLHHTEESSEGRQMLLTSLCGFLFVSKDVCGEIPPSQSHRHNYSATMEFKNV